MGTRSLMSTDSAYVTTRRPRALGQGESELKSARGRTGGNNVVRCSTGSASVGLRSECPSSIHSPSVNGASTGASSPICMEGTSASSAHLVHHPVGTGRVRLGLISDQGLGRGVRTGWTAGARRVSKGCGKHGGDCRYADKPMEGSEPKSRLP